MAWTGTIIGARPPLVQSMAARLGLSADQVEQMFVAASGISV